jgi:hypothetical protein
MQSDLYQRTLSLVRNRPPHITLKLIGRETNISEDWLKSFSCGRANNPSSVRLELLFKYLSDLS